MQIEDKVKKLIAEKLSTVKDAVNYIIEST